MFDHTEDDRAYDREIARLEREKRARGDESAFPVFAVPLSELDSLLTEGRAEYGHPGSWDGTPDIDPNSDPERVVNKVVAEPEEVETTLCGMRIHEMTPENTIQGQCRSCKNISKRRGRSAKLGKPLCWQGIHPEPAEGMVCECGDVPPPDDFVDWVLVENAVAGRELCRPLTNAELVTTLTTVAYRWDDVTGPYGARRWLREYTNVRLSTAQVEYLFIKWLPANGGVARSAGEVFLRDIQQAAGVTTV